MDGFHQARVSENVSIGDLTFRIHGIMPDDMEFAYRLFKAREAHDSLPTLGLTCFLVVLFFQVADLAWSPFSWVVQTGRLLQFAASLIACSYARNCSHENAYQGLIWLDATLGVLLCGIASLRPAMFGPSIFPFGNATVSAWLMYVYYPLYFPRT